MSLTNRLEPDTRSGSWSLALRLTAWYVGISFAILLVATISLYIILIGNIRREQDQFLEAKVNTVRDMLQTHPEDIADLKEEVEQSWAPKQFARAYVRVLDESGRVLVESPRMSERFDPADFPPVAPQSAVLHGSSIKSRTGITYRGVSATGRIGGLDGGGAVIQAALNIDTARDLIQGYRRQILIVLGAGLAVCGLAGYWLARVGLKPLRNIAATSQRIRSTNLGERINPEGLPAELCALALRFNEMLDRIEEAFVRLSRFSADIAHELRTPVNNMRIEVEVGLGRARSLEEYRETLGSCLEECGRLTRIIDSMLFIARSEDPRTHIAKEPVDVSRELERLREFFDVPASEAGVQLLVTCAPDVRADLDRTMFQRAVSNLLGNAIRYTPPGGRVAVSAARENGELRVDVTDTGTGIVPEDLPHIFDRFYRADAARSTAAGNVGLGLAIVKSIVTLHGGSIGARSKPNDGTCMSMRLPAGKASEDADAGPATAGPAATQDAIAART